MENRLMTIMFLDMQGYTKRSAQQTIDEMKLFHDQMFSFVSEIIDRWNGKMVKSLGDGFLVRFESPTNAVQAGIEIQRKLEARNAQMMNPDSLVRFRVGINTGEVGVDENGDLFGDPVNIASRIQTFADTNDVFISESTFLAMNQNEFGAVDLGAQALKNATREIRIYKVLKNGSPGQIKGSQSSGFDFGKHRKHLVVAVLGLVVFFAGALVFKAIKNRRASDNGKTEDVKVADQSEPTIMDLQPEDPRLKFAPQEAKAFAELKVKFSEKRFAEAEKICLHMINTQQALKQIPWGMCLVEVLHREGKSSEAEKLSKNLLEKSKVSQEIKGRIKTQLERIRKKYRK